MRYHRPFSTYDWCNDGTHNEGDHVSPSGESNVLLDDDNQAENKATNEDCDIPPPGSLLVVLSHVLVVAIIISSLPGALESLDDVLTPEEDAVKDESTDLLQV